MSDGIRAMWMRGGTSKGGYFLAGDLPADTQARDALLLRIMGSPDARQIDGLGGGSPLTSKVAIVAPGSAPGIDLDYLFLQVFVDRAQVSDAQTCGNILAGVAPFAIERGLIKAAHGTTDVTIRNTNTGQIIRATVQTPGRRVRYAGSTYIDGVPGTSAPVQLFFSNIAGSKCGALLPSGAEQDVIDGITCTLIDNGMPTVIVAADDFGLSGTETPEALDDMSALKQRLELIRRQAGPMMNLGDVAQQSVPKMCLVSPPRAGGVISTRCFIPHSCHKTIGVLCAVSVATACGLGSGPASRLARMPQDRTGIVAVEHPSGAVPVMLRYDETGQVVEAGSVRTARKLFDGQVFA